MLLLGINAIDENIISIIEQMGSFSENHMSDMTSLARAIGQVLCLFVVGGECFQVMTGKKSFDFLKIMRPCALALVIMFWGSYVSIIGAPGQACANYAKTIATAQNDIVKDWETKRVQAALGLRERLKEKRAAAEMAEKSTSDKSLLEEVVDAGADLLAGIKDQILSWYTAYTAWVNSKILEAVQWVGEVAWQVSYYGLLLCAQIFMGILAIFGPVAFALSVVPAWHDAWSQWTSRYISVSLYTCLTYLVITYVDQIFIYALRTDYNTMMAATGGLDLFTSYCDSSVGTAGCYIVACFLGCFAIRWVPELASWIIPAQASQNAAHMVSGVQNSITRAVVSSAAHI